MIRLSAAAKNELSILIPTSELHETRISADDIAATCKLLQDTSTTTTTTETTGTTTTTTAIQLYV